jgi:hypothetical protein
LKKTCKAGLGSGLFATGHTGGISVLYSRHLSPEAYGLFCKRLCNDDKKALNALLDLSLIFLGVQGAMYGA